MGLVKGSQKQKYTNKQKLIYQGIFAHNTKETIFYKLSRILYKHYQPFRKLYFLLYCFT